MIKIRCGLLEREEILKYSKFPDGTLNIKGNPDIVNHNILITWMYENDAEFMELAFVTRYYQDNGNNVSLFLPYVPNARMDRVENNADVFTLKYFCELINNLNYTEVTVLDVHSNKTIGFIDRCYIEDVFESIKGLINYTESQLVFFPDKGSMERYSKKINVPYAYGEKKRDWNTGKILDLNVCGIEEDGIKGKSIIIIDDICSYGGTFYYSAKKLKEMGADKVFLYVTHCENSILNGAFGDKKENLLDTGLIETVFTTNSICTVDHEKINKIAIYCRH